MRGVKKMIHRYVCTVLEELRQCHHTSNYGHLLGLVAEAQTLVNRMESKLCEQKEAERLHDTIKKLRKEIEKLRKEKKELDNDSTSE